MSQQIWFPLDTQKSVECEHRLFYSSCSYYNINIGESVTVWTNYKLKITETLIKILAKNRKWYNKNTNEILLMITGYNNVINDNWL